MRDDIKVNHRVTNSAIAVEREPAHGALRFQSVKRQSNRDQAREWFEFGCECESDGDLIQASGAYRRVIAVAPNHAEAHFNLGNVLRILGCKTEAARHFHRAVQCNQSFAPAWYNLADVLDDDGHIQQAIACLERAVAIDPQYADAHFNLARCFERLGKMHEALQHWSRYLTLDSLSEWASMARCGLDRCRA